jgi:two-component system sensor histidine kinase CpxA
MRSITGKILLKCIGAVLFVFVSLIVFKTSVKFSNLNEFQVDMMAKAYQAGGSARLTQYVQQVQSAFPGLEYHLTDAAGKDLASGKNESALLRRAGLASLLYGTPGRVIAASTSPDGKYRSIMVANIPSSPGFDFSPYLVVVLPTLLWLCYSLIRDIASPLKSLTQTLDHFGQGDLSARMRSGRKDQIGDLTRSFDAMAERIQVLLNAERRLLQDVAHELRSPLARLTLASGLLSEETTRQRGIGQIRRDIDRLKLLIGALLQVTRAEGDRSTLKFVPTNVPQLLDEVIADCRLEADAQACRIEPRIAGNVSVSADAELLRRAIENILRNAIKYSPENGVIDLALESGASEVAIVVRDYGPGVADEMLSKIILPFFRVDEARDGLTGGAGLGLAIADRAIQLHKGKILVRNASPGLRVSLMLPLEVSTQ